MPIRNVVTILPRFRSLAAPVTTPASTRSTTASVNISVWIPRSFLSVRAIAVADGIAPIPSWSVARSGTSSATCSPIRRSTSPIVGPAWTYGGTSTSTARSMSSTWTKLSPRVRGIEPVELDDHRLRGPDRGVHRLDARAERAEAVSVGRRGVDQHDIERECPALEQPRDVREEDRHVVGPTLVDRLPRVRADEQRPVPEVALHLRREVRTGTLGVEVDHGHVVEVGGAGNQRVEEHRRRRGRAMDVDAITGADDGDGFLGRDDAHQQSLRGRAVQARAGRTTPEGPSGPDVRAAICRPL